jgi:hypothetical protein
VTVDQLAEQGVHAADGSSRVSVVSGASFTGLSAPDGSFNVVPVLATDISTFGIFHPSGALRGVIDPDATFKGLYAPNGAFWMSGLEKRNFILNGFDPTHVSWSLSGVLAFNDVAAGPQTPSLIGDRLEETAITGSFTANPAGVAVLASTVYSWSVFGKASQNSLLYINAFLSGLSDNRTWFDLSAGTVLTNGAGNTPKIEAYGNGWYKCTVTRSTDTATATSLVIGLSKTDATVSYTGTAGDGVFVYGPQLKLGTPQ